MRRKGSITKRCMVCIMSAMMMMSSVAGTMIAPMGAYAADYNTTADVPEDENHNRNLASGDTLTTNTGTIHENNGIIKDNAEDATVEINNNEIQKNEGTVVENAAGATVGAQNIEGAGTVTNNYGTAEKSNVENNYGTAKDSIVKDNYGNAKDSHVNSNWSSGTVTGISSVAHEYGGNVADTVDVTEYNDPNPGPKPPVVKVNDSPSDTISEVQSDTPKPEETNDPPQPKVKKTNDGYVSELVNEIDKKLNGIVRNETITIDFRDRDNLTVDELRTLLFYTPSNITINCIFVKDNGERYYLYIYPRIPQLTIGEKGNVVLVTDWAYHSCLDELSKEDGQLAGPNRIVEIFNEFHIECKLVHKGAPGVLKPEDPPRYDNIKDISIQSDQPQTTAITNAKAQTTAITNAKAQTAAITNANAAIAQANTSVRSADVDDVFSVEVQTRCDEYLKVTSSLIAEGGLDKANALIANGFTIDAGTHQGLYSATLAKLGEASRMGIAVTVNFTYGGADYSVTIPGNSQIDPATLVDENGYCNFLNLLNYFK